LISLSGLAGDGVFVIHPERDPSSRFFFRYLLVQTLFFFRPDGVLKSLGTVFPVSSPMGSFPFGEEVRFFEMQVIPDSFLLGTSRGGPIDLPI